MTNCNNTAETRKNRVMLCHMATAIAKSGCTTLFCALESTLISGARVAVQAMLINEKHGGSALYSALPCMYCPRNSVCTGRKTSLSFHSH